MLDFAIFAVTFLLALVGAVLYLYPVTPDSGGEGAPAPQGPGLRGALTGESRGSAPECSPCAHACCGLWAVVLVGSGSPCAPVGYLEVAISYLV